MSSEVDIRVRNLSKVFRIYERPEDRLIQMATLGRVRRFTEFPALTDISLDIRRGETVGIVGRNGCGKSTLLQIICGTLQPTSGTVEVQGRIAALLELGAGFNGEFTGRENVYMNGAILGFSREEMEARFEQIAAFAGIGDFIERPVKTYSSGMFVRLAFAVATALEPDILVVDEALAVGDEAFQRKCFARIEAIKGCGGTILFVSHAAQTIVQLCDRAVLLDGGEKLLDGPPKAIVTQYQRLVNASAEGTAEVRQQIVAMRDSRQLHEEPDPIVDLVTGAEAAVVGHPGAATHAARLVPAGGTGGSQDNVARSAPVLPPSTADAALADYYDPNLVSESAVSLEERGARISDVRITTLAGEPVNVLRMGRRYVFSGQVDFHESAAHVSFGVQFRTTSGVAVAGAHSSQVKSMVVKSLSRGATVRTRFEFTCILLPGVYFAVCGVQGQPAGEQILMHRIYDSLVFRVAREEDLIATGQSDADFSFSLVSQAAN